MYVTCQPGGTCLSYGAVTDTKAQQSRALIETQCPSQSRKTAGSASATIPAVHGSAASDACLEVHVQATRSGVLKSGLSWPASPGPVGFTTNEEDGEFLNKCLSGCRNILVYVQEAGGGAGVGDVQVKVSVSPITTDVTNSSQGGGYLCEVASTLMESDGRCGSSLTVTTDSAGLDEGRAYLRYYPPAVYVPEGKAPPTGTITAEVHSCGLECTTVQGQTDVEVGSHLIVQKLGVGLTWPEKQMLIEWEENGTIIKHVKPVDKTLSTLSKLFDKNKKLYALAKAVGDLAKGVKLYGSMADYTILEWFDQRFGLIDDGLVHLGSVNTLANEILKYVKDPVLGGIAAGLKEAFFKSGTYTDQAIKMLRSYAHDWLWTDETNRDTQVMNAKVFEASYCQDSICRSLAPGFGVHFNLYVTFSSADFTQGTPFFKTFNVTDGYAAPTWLPEQCAALGNRTKQADQCGGTQ